MVLPLQERPRRLWVAWVQVLIAAVLGVVVGAVSFVVTGYVKVTTNVKHEAISKNDLGSRPDKVSPAMNVLIVGSDVRRARTRNTATSPASAPTRSSWPTSPRSGTAPR